MNEYFSGLRKAFESGRIGRRELMQALGATAATAFAASMSPEAAAFAAGGAQAGMAGGAMLKAVAYNHINYQVTDYAKACANST